MWKDWLLNAVVCYPLIFWYKYMSSCTLFNLYLQRAVSLYIWNMRKWVEGFVNSVRYHYIKGFCTSICLTLWMIRGFFKTQSKVIVNQTANWNIFYSKTFIFGLNMPLAFSSLLSCKKKTYSTEILPLISTKTYTFGNTHTSRPITDHL